MSKLVEYLNRQMVGNVFERPSILQAYSTDRSILEIIPQAVAVPETSDDIQRLMRFIYQLSIRGLHLPVTVRGGGLDKTGACLGSGLIISTERLNHIEELDTRGRLVRAQAGVTIGELNTALKLHGLWLPVNCHPGTTIGGLISGSPADDYSARFGGIQNYLDRAEVILPGGDLIQLAPTKKYLDKKLSPSERKLYLDILKIHDEQDDTIVDRGMQPFDAAGYANIVYARKHREVNLLPLLQGSQGTLGIITDLILKVEPLPSPSKRCLVILHDLKSALRFLEFASMLDPLMIKIYDMRILNEALSYGKRSSLLAKRVGSGILAVLSFSGRRANKSISICIDKMPKGSSHIVEDETNHGDFQILDDILLSFLNDHPGGQYLPVLDDVYIPPSALANYFDGLKELEKTLKLEMPVFGSYITSNYSARPRLDLASLSDRQKLADFMELYSGLVEQCGGSVTGNTPEGRVKALVRPATSSVGEKQLYTSIKSAFDPQNLLNPGVKLGAKSQETLSHLLTREKIGIITP